MSARQSRAIFLLLVVVAVGATLIFTLRTEALADKQRHGEEQQAWTGVESAPFSGRILRPIWLPPEFRHHPDVGSESWGPGKSSGYNVFYCAADCSGSQPTELELSRNPNDTSRELDSSFHVRVRGTRGAFSIYHEGPVYQLSWREAGQRYAVSGTNVWPSQLLKVAASLRPVTPTG